MSLVGPALVALVMFLLILTAVLIELRHKTKDWSDD